MHTTLLARIGANRQTSASGQLRPEKVGVPKGCSAISRADSRPVSPSMLTKATPSGLAIRPKRIRPAYPGLTCTVNADGISPKYPCAALVSMPTYRYRCESCGPFDLVRPMATVVASEPCPACGEGGRRVFGLPGVTSVDPGIRAALDASAGSADSPA